MDNNQIMAELREAYVEQNYEATLFVFELENKLDGINGTDKGDVLELLNEKFNDMMRALAVF